MKPMATYMVNNNFTQWGKRERKYKEAQMYIHYNYLGIW